MDILNDFSFKQKKYMPIFPKAIGKPTVYIKGYPCEDDEPMAATDFHAEQITTLSDQLKGYFAINELVHIGVDSFIYYSEGDITKCVASDIYIVFGVEKYPLRRSFYTWVEGAVPVAIFEFLSDSTANQDRNEKVQVYLKDVGAREYFIHQPEMEKPAEFRGWQQGPSEDIVEIEPDAQGGLFSEALNLWFRWEEQLDTYVRLLRPYLPDGTPIPTSMEERQLREEQQQLREAAEARTAEEQQRRMEERQLREEQQQLREAAEARTAEEQQRRMELETELERLRAQLANTKNEST